MLVALAIGMIIIGLFIVRKIAPIQVNRNMKIFLFILGAVFFIGGGVLWWLVGTGRIVIGV